MNRWAANCPELYEQLGHEGYVEHFRENADLIRKAQKEGDDYGNPDDHDEPVSTDLDDEGRFVPDSEGGGIFDRYGRQMLPCRVCGENLAPNGGECDRCRASVDEDRLNRGD